MSQLQKVFCLAILIPLLITACSSSTFPTATSTISPTNTVLPTKTSTPRPTATLEPTNTVEVTATPVVDDLSRVIDFTVLNVGQKTKVKEAIIVRMGEFIAGDFCTQEEMENNGFVPEGSKSDAEVHFGSLMITGDNSVGNFQVTPLAVIKGKAKDIIGGVEDDYFFIVVGFENKNGEREVTIFKFQSGKVFRTGGIPYATLWGRVGDKTSAKVTYMMDESMLIDFMESRIGLPVTFQLELLKKEEINWSEYEAYWEEDGRDAEEMRKLIAESQESAIKNYELVLFSYIPESTSVSLQRIKRLSESQVTEPPLLIREIGDIDLAMDGRLIPLVTIFLARRN